MSQNGFQNPAVLTEIDEVNRRVEVSHSASASGYIFYSQYKSTCGLKGDFDIQVDYKLLEWPSANGIRVGLAVQDKSQSGGVVERVSVSKNDFTTPIELILQTLVERFKAWREHRTSPEL